MATPHVAGAAALLWSKNLAGQSADAIVALLKRGAPIPKVIFSLSPPPLPCMHMRAFSSLHACCIAWYITNQSFINSPR